MCFPKMSIPGPSLSPRSPRRKTSKSCSAEDVAFLSGWVGSAPSGFDTATFLTMSFSFSALAFSSSAAFNFASSLYLFSYLKIKKKKTYETAYQNRKASTEIWNQISYEVSTYRAIGHAQSTIQANAWSHNVTVMFSQRFRILSLINTFTFKSVFNRIFLWQVIEFWYEDKLFTPSISNDKSI